MRSFSLIILIAMLCNPQASYAQNQQSREAAIFELPSPPEPTSDFNWYFPAKVKPDDAAPASRREIGAHQAMWEPLFVLDYATAS